MRLRHILASIGLSSALALCAASARAEYIVLHSGARLNVTGYQLLGDKYRLQLVAVLPKCPLQRCWLLSRKRFSTRFLSPSAQTLPSAKLSVKPPRATMSTQT